MLSPSSSAGSWVTPERWHASWMNSSVASAKNSATGPRNRTLRRGADDLAAPETKHRPVPVGNTQFAGARGSHDQGLGR